MTIEGRASESPGETPALCGARTRNGLPCRNPPVNGKRRCRMHGGAAGSGAPKGNQNALKTGFYKRQYIDLRRQSKRAMREALMSLGRKRW